MNLSHPHVSVIIPTCNRRNYVTEAIDSVLAQTYDDREIVVVDDGSTDDTQTVLAAYGDSIRSVYQEHAGCAGARNRGVRESRGRWIAFLDSDDVWLPEKLAIQMTDLAKHPQAHAHVVNAHMFRDDADEPVDLFRFIGFDRHVECSPVFLRRPLDYQLRYGFGWPQSVLVRRDILMQAGLFNERLRLWQDTDMYCRVAAHCNWVVNATPLVRILRRSDGDTDLSRQSIEARLVSHRELVLTYGTLYTHRHLSRREKRLTRRCLSISLSSLGVEQCRERTDMREARRNLLRGFTIHPTVGGLLRLLAGCLPGRHGIGLVVRWQSVKGAIDNALRRGGGGKTPVPVVPCSSRVREAVAVEASAARPETMVSASTVTGLDEPEGAGMCREGAGAAEPQPNGASREET